MVKDNDWFTCPVCGEVVQANALACPHCGADDETGWSDDAEYDDLGLDDAVFGGPPAKPTQESSRWFKTVAVLLLVAIFLLWVVMGW